MRVCLPLLSVLRLFVVVFAIPAGNGGFLGATGTEFDTGEVLPPEMPKVYPRVRLVFFCPAAQDGTPYDHAICPESIVGQFNLAKAVQSLQPGIDVDDWDVQEVKPK